MKLTAFVLLLLLVSKCLLAQKENNVWVGGNFVGLNFNSGAPVVSPRGDSTRFWRTNASICNRHTGDLLFYTNGFRIFNKNYQVMQNGDALNIGDYVNWGYGLLALENGAAIVPVPGDSNRYYVFHADANILNYDTLAGVLLPTHIFYDLEDITLAGGLGAVVSGQKDVPVVHDTLPRFGFKVVKHANGRDYWLLYHHVGNDVFKRFLVDPYGIHGPYTQAIGNAVNGEEDVLGYSPFGFSWDGTRLAHVSAFTDGEWFDFDRCTGLLSNRRGFVVSDTLYEQSRLEFSPSDRYLYVTANQLHYILQFDLDATDIAASRQIVAVYDGAQNPFPTDFDALRLGPDGKIYCASFAGNRSLHVINYPDSAGLACGFVENAIQVYPPGVNWSGLPNEVNYSLGPLYGSGCDTLTSTNNLPQSVFTWSAYPNPFEGELQLNVSGATTKASINITDVLGRNVYNAVLNPNGHFIHQTVDASKLASGVYIVSLTVSGNRYVQKVVKR